MSASPLFLNKKEFENRCQQYPLKRKILFSSFGEITVLLSGKYICGLAFNLEKFPQDKGIPFRLFYEDDLSLDTQIIDNIFNDIEIPLLLVGSPFQHQVWKTLLNIPKGQAISYQELADLAGYPKAVHAVASAIACNPISWIVPCHRIIPKTGEIGQFRWGSDIKQKLIESEKK